MLERDSFRHVLSNRDSSRPTRSLRGGPGGSIRVAMPWTLLKLANKARGLPELEIVLRIALGLAGAFLLFRVVTNAMNPADLALTDYVGLVLFTVVGLWLIRAALRRSG